MAYSTRFFTQAARWGAAATVALSTSIGCMYGPYDDEDVDPYQSIAFQGFAQHAGATVEVQAYNKLWDRWDVIATDTASSSPVVFGGDSLHPWSTSVVFANIPDSYEIGRWQCYWANNCFFPDPDDVSFPEWNVTALIRAREIGGDFSGGALVTFDEGGINCTVDGVYAGDGWVASGYLCRDTELNYDPVTEGFVEGIVHLHWDAFSI